jgi:LmbE family N-acetylglucosaminyl deacetylase
MTDLASATRRPLRVQAVVAHPDDETFGCGALLLHARASGAVLAVTCATRGEEGESTSDDPDLGAVREAELHAAARALGVAHVDLLGFRDSGMSGVAGPGSLVGAPFGDVVAAVRDRVAAFEPDILLTLDGSDGHRDHVRVRDAVLEVAGLLGVPQVYLACLSRSLMRRWCDHQQVVHPGSPYLDVDEAGLGTPDDLVTTCIDVGEHRAALEVAMRAHASQHSPYDGLPAGLADAFLDTARARRVVPPWSGGHQETALGGTCRDPA